jgi:hypothetical protein
MKKIILVLSAFVFIFNSCSTSSTDPVTPVIPVTLPSGVLLTKTITTSNTGVIVTNNYNYNGNMLNSVTSTNKSSQITYSGDLITKIEDFSGTILKSRETFSYNASNNLSSLIEIDFSATPTISANRTDYTYLANGDITEIIYSGDLTSQTNQESTGKLFFTNGEITKHESYYPLTIDHVAYTSTKNYSYDSKNSPYKNITGLSKIWFFLYFMGSFNNNVTSLNNSSTLGPVSSFNYVNSYAYNTLDYPTKQTSLRNGTLPFITEYFY